MLSASSRRLAGTVRRQVAQRFEPTIKPSNLHQQPTRRFSTAGQGGQGESGSGGSEASGGGGLWKGIAVVGASALVGGYIYAYHVWPETHPDTLFPIPLPPNPLDAIWKSVQSAPASPAALTASTTAEGPKNDKNEEVTSQQNPGTTVSSPELASEKEVAPTHVSLSKEEITEETPALFNPEPVLTSTPSLPSKEEFEEKVAEVVEEALHAVSGFESEVEEAAKSIQEIFQGETETSTENISSSTGESTENTKDVVESTDGDSTTISEEQLELSPAQLVVSCEERLAVLRQHYENVLLQLDQRANHLHQQVNDEKERHLELKEAFITMRDLYEEKLRKLEEESEDRTNRLLFEARTEMLREVDKTIKETDSLCELRNAKLHEARLKQISQVYHRVLELKNAALSQDNMEKAEHKREQITLALSSVILALQQNKPTLNKELRHLLELVKNRPDLQQVLNHIPKAFISGEGHIQSREDLKSRFETVLQVARTQSLVPEDGGLFWQLWASTVSKVTPSIFPNSSAEDKTADGVLSRALHFVKTDDFLSAVKELHKLKGNASDVVQSWVGDVQDRLLLETSLWCAIDQLNSLVSPSSPSSSSASPSTTPSTAPPKCH